MIQAVIFDMDGLMFDSERVWLKSWDIALAEKSLPLHPELFQRIAGSNRERCLQAISELYPENSDAIDAAENHYAIAQRLFEEEGAPPKDGLFELLDYLETRDIPKAVASSSSDSIVRACLSKVDITDRFDAIETGDLALPSKPAPDIFLAAAYELSADPTHTIVLEDSGNGIRAAHAGGFIPIWVPDLVLLDDKTRALARHEATSLAHVPNVIARYDSQG